MRTYEEESNIPWPEYVQPCGVEQFLVQVVDHFMQALHLLRTCRPCVRTPRYDIGVEMTQHIGAIKRESIKDEQDVTYFGKHGVCRAKWEK